MRGCLRIVGIILGVLVIAFVVFGVYFWLNWKRGNELSDQAREAYRAGKPAEALASYQELLSVFGLNEYKEDYASNKVDELTAYLNAIDFYENDQIDQAITTFKAFMDEHCHEWDSDNLYCSFARKNLALAIPGYAQQLHQKGDYAEAIDLYLSSLNLVTLGDAECPPIMTDEGQVCQEADSAIEQSHSQTFAAIPEVMLDWTNTLKELGDYQDFAETCDSFIEEHPDMFDDDQFKAIMAHFYYDWAELLRHNESYTDAIEKYMIVLDRYADTPKGELTRTTIEEIQVEYAAWLEDNPAVPLVEFPQEVSRDSEGRWSWTTVFKETGGKVGYSVSGSGWIEAADGNRYGPWGSTLDRGTVEVPPGGEGEDSYWVRGDTFVDGYAVITWEGEDEGGHPITIEVRIHLLP